MPGFYSLFEKKEEDEVPKTSQELEAAGWFLAIRSVTGVLCLLIACVTIYNCRDMIPRFGGEVRHADATEIGGKPHAVPWPSSYTWLGADEEYLFETHDKSLVRVTITKVGDAEKESASKH